MRLMGEHRRRVRSGRRKLVAVVAIAIPLAALGVASPAMAEPQGIFKIFNQCPTELPGVTLCNYAQTTSGEFTIGSTRVPIFSTDPITLQGGDIPTGNPENEREFFAVPAKNGESLSKTELNVPGGLLDIIKCEDIEGEKWLAKEARAACKAFFEGKLLGVTATTELVANETDPVIFNEEALGSEEGTALTLPLRVHLKNPFLGNSCYIGSEEHPLTLHLTTGATEPPAGVESIHGALGKLETLKENGVRMIHISGNSLVDNTFAAPEAYGCGELFGYTGFLDKVVDAKLKIPNSPGENVAKLDGELNAASAENVIASESF
jgi:hypothetical protein